MVAELYARENQFSQRVSGLTRDITAHFVKSRTSFKRNRIKLRRKKRTLQSSFMGFLHNSQPRLMDTQDEDDLTLLLPNEVDESGSAMTLASYRRFRKATPPEWTRMYFEVKKALLAIDMRSQQVQEYFEVLSSISYDPDELSGQHPIEPVLDEVGKLFERSIESLKRVPYLPLTNEERAMAYNMRTSFELQMWRSIQNYLAIEKVMLRELRNKRKSIQFNGPPEDIVVIIGKNLIRLTNLSVELKPINEGSIMNSIEWNVRELHASMSVGSEGTHARRSSWSYKRLLVVLGTLLCLLLVMLAVVLRIGFGE